MDIKRAIGSPFSLLSIGDFVVISFYIVMFFTILSIASLALPKLMLWRYTGTTSTSGATLSNLTTQSTPYNQPVGAA